MTSQENKQIVNRFVEGFWNQGQLATVDELMTADAQIYLPGAGQVSKEVMKNFNTAIRSAFPDWHSTQEELIVEGDRVVERWTGRGTHQRVFQGIPATGKQVAVPGFVYYRIAHGKIAEFRGLFDGLSMLQQLGSLPTPQPAGK